MEKTRQLLLLVLQIGVEQGFVAFTAAPEDIVLAAEFEGGIHGIFNLSGGQGKDMGIRIG